MSKHFTGKEEAVRRTSLSYLLSPSRPRTVGEQKFVRHAIFRATAVIGLLVYFVYCNPEYSYTFSFLRERYGLGEGKPLIPKLLELRKNPPGG
ncbi:hypothetical protein LSM04_001623 [Trypanosoma melophagium]|uniref:uncharacterized protein n=1 Tax=Trypanosoma melophagium TaxID=715481 RepID=UPI00351A03D1|nr:hypothetical protein LSM04_001623 [Trypanosoma melophagium]